MGRDSTPSKKGVETTAYARNEVHFREENLQSLLALDFIKTKEEDIFSRSKDVF